MTDMTTTHRTALKDNADLSIYWDNHLRDAFMESAQFIYPPMVEASLAHVFMLSRQGVLPKERGVQLLTGLLELWKQTTTETQEFVFDGSVEDPYYYFEQQLAIACDISTAELDVQLARSRNDLDAGAFRMVLRRQLLDQIDLVVQTAADAARLAADTADAVIIGFTHRRPAQPTTIGHVLAGLSEALLSQADEMLSVYDELNISPLGSAAFAGTDLNIDSALVGELLGFDRSFTSSYEAVAGAEHFMRLAAVHGRVTATGARWARVLLEWMTFRWVETPTAFTQGSSIMPQKKNPVVLEHLVSMAGATAADMAATYANIGSSWYEDSNNATTDVQKHLWRSGERVVRFVRLVDGLFESFRVLELPSAEQIVKSGATTTAVAEALAAEGIAWRSAHHVVGDLVAAADPITWTTTDVTAAFERANIPVTDALVDLTLKAGVNPNSVLNRSQLGGPGREAVMATAKESSLRAASASAESAERRTHIDAARRRLLDLVQAAVRSDTW
ncbi:lyase family protein [Cryobacterium sp. N21]|uniref:lyase family protein n=1 Tax=Cryobacterium sp. N21 TaxID=2048289 RepID=UPI0018EA8B44|nr:lyase family protein [Cryobacterium sp. N21]